MNVNALSKKSEEDKETRNIVRLPTETKIAVVTYIDLHAKTSTQYNTTLLPSVNTIALGIPYGAKYTNHKFTPIIKHH